MSLGEAITTARRARGRTQEGLAAAAGIHQAALSRYENDLRGPSDEVLSAIARELHLTPALLQRAGRMRGALAVDAHMRRRKSARATTWRRLEAELNLNRLHAQSLFEEIAMMSSSTVPSLDPIETSPADAARIVRMQWRMPSGPVRDLVGWLESAGCVVIEKGFGTARVDGMSQWIDDNPIVMINSAAPTDRCRLTLAHELGHLCLHNTEPTADVEADANAFAAEFLLPAETIRPQLRNLTVGRLHDLKREWGVSMQALVERAHNLGVMRSKDRTNMYKRFSSLGWRTREPVSDELAPEVPALASAIGKALLDKGLTPAEVSELAGYSPAADSNPFLPGRPHLRAI